ncbi:hypothetical protein NIES4071_101470 (plasmid) [Calothrix sp. NIES-4071]|nr:hypothetical protein NIES4071_101470 [Calothrix sp. NIES-4071]BAZ64528.1 hypothetical protein NIES4105_102610 [Calothrix sp. NIES-4105]
MQEQVDNRIEQDLELEGNPFTLPEVTDEEAIKLGNYYLSGEYLIRNERNSTRKKTKGVRRACLPRSSRKRNIRKNGEDANKL